MQFEVVIVWEVPDVKVKVFVEIEVMTYVPSTPAPEVASKIIVSPTDLPWVLLVIVTVVPDCVYTALIFVLLVVLLATLNIRSALLLTVPEPVKLLSGQSSMLSVKRIPLSCSVKTRFLKMWF